MRKTIIIYHDDIGLFENLDSGKKKDRKTNLIILQ